MGDGTKIQWTDATWNPTRGCTRVSSGCGGPGPHGGCYAEGMAARFSKPAQDGRPAQWGYGFAEMRNSKPRWTGKVALIESMLTLPLTWKTGRRIFVNSTSDLFHEALPDEAIDRVFAVMALAPQHTFQILTKRPERMRKYLTGIYGEGFTARDRIDNVVLGWLQENSHPEILRSGRLDCVNDGYDACENWPLPNVWLGTSAEDQATADERIPDLLETPAAVRFVSYEPALGPVDFRPWLEGREEHGMVGNCIGWTPPLDLIIGGSESGPHARPAPHEWFRNVAGQCRDASVSFFMKQLSGPGGRAIKDMDAFPVDLRVREMPEVTR